MTPETAFKEFESTVNADPDQLSEARLRRDAFLTALEGDDDVDRTTAIGSLARKTQKAPLNDVDAIVVYDRAAHPDWGKSAVDATSVDALTHTAKRIKELLGRDGSHVELLNPNGGNDLHVRLVHKKRHAVKCFLDHAGERDAFTVDIVPAIACPDRGLWIPERDLDEDQNSTWIRTDPEYLIARALELQDRWDFWVPSIRLLKFWNTRSGAGMTSLYLEVLGHSALPTNETRQRALARFFQAAEWQVSAALADPAGLCGPIQPDLDVDRARSCLAEAAEVAWRAVNAEADGREDDAVCAWRSLLGDEFPAPPGGCDGAESTTAASAGAPAFLVTKKPATPRRVKDEPQG